MPLGSFKMSIAERGGFFKKLFQLTGLLLSFVSSMAYGSAIAQYQAFIESSSTLKVHFSQTVKTHNKVQKATGILEIRRPGSFRWTYDKPYQQIIIGRDKTLWIYDVALSQATQKSMGSFMSPSYEMLLAGSADLESSYELSEQGSQNGLEWLLGTSKKMSNLFRSVRMGFKQDTLVKMELVDRLDQKIVLTFRNMQKNIPLSEERFIFKAPPGVEIVAD
jgi:chaperone LolA